jgi:phenylacetate-CoA ligase
MGGQHLADVQRERLRALLAEVLPHNPFYAAKFAGHDVSRLDIRAWPFTTKSELLADQKAHPPYGTNLTFSLAHYTRFHQTSGTSGQPLRWLDTAASWDVLLGCWQKIYALAGIRRDDRLFFAFSFGPFLGFWTAFEAGTRLGHLCLASGGMSSAARLRLLLDNEATIVLCTPTYALRLAEVAAEQGIALSSQTSGYRVRALIVAGEPGGSIPTTRARIENAWHARVFDHSGMTEVGPVAVECLENPGGLHILEDDYLAEVIDPRSLEPVSAGTIGELVLTNFGRVGSPLIRYRTGDLVRVDGNPCPCGRPWLRLDGGIQGRTDDMLYLRGNNVYPSALEAVLRRFNEVGEYRAIVSRNSALTALRIEVEGSQETADRVSEAIREELLFRAEVVAVATGSLPRNEMKTRRIIHE